MAATNQDREARQARRKARSVPAVNNDTFELTWPYFMYTIVLCFLLTTIVLWVWSMAIPAPLEPIADPNKTPNPSKAPWYFVGLQELLVYFDPWIAGVVLPTLIIVGLMAIPYLDKSPVGIGEYNYKDRKFAFWVFTIGMIFWFVLIIIGQAFRGPSWQWYWPRRADADFPPRALGLPGVPAEIPQATPEWNSHVAPTPRAKDSTRPCAAQTRAR